MILGLGIQPAAECFRELDDAVRALTDRTVVFNAHVFPERIPDGAVVYNLENDFQLSPYVLDLFKNHEVWDFNEAHARKMGWKHVPIGYHPSMERFEMRPWEERDIDVVFAGAVNDRRYRVLQKLVAQGLKVTVIPHGVYGAARDELLSRSKAALNMLYYENGTYPLVRAAHLIANRVPMVSEDAPGRVWRFIQAEAYEELVEACSEFIENRYLRSPEHCLDEFKKIPLALP